MSSKALHLMFACAGKSAGGAELNFLRTCEVMHKLGEERVKITPVVRQGSWLDKSLSEAKIPHTTAPFMGWFDFITKLYLKRLIAAQKPDLIQCWMNRATSMMPKIKGIPLIGRLGGYYKLKNYTHADHLVANVKGIVHYLREAGWAENDITLVPNFAGFPPKNFAETRDEVRRYYDIPKSATVLIASSRLHPHKGQETLLRAMAELPGNVYAILAGHGPDEDMLKALTKTLQIEDRVRFVGWVDNISPLFGASDIFVVTSRVEPMGNVILHAWTHHLPLITSDATGPQEVVESGITGLVYPIDNHQALAEKVKIFIEQPALAQTIADAGLQYVMAHYADDAIVEKYLALYHRLLAEEGTVK